MLGLTYGLLVGPMTDTFSDLSEQFVAILGAENDVLNGYLGFIALYHVVLVGVFGILAVQGLRAEEIRGRAEPVRATPTSRVAWYGTHLAVAATAAALILAGTGLAFGVGAAVSGDDARLVWELTAAHVAHVPEVLVFMGIAALLYGVMPRALPLAGWCWSTRHCLRSSAR